MTLRAAAEQALKPCPFCGSEPYSCRHLSYSNWGVTCECGAIGPTKNAGYRPLREAEIRAHNEAVAAWNERAALAAEQPEPVAVSEWRMVPVEPTKAMLAAADKIMDCDPLWVARGYRAMIEAAPPPSAPERETKP